jgi:hypothetical protein
MIATIRAGLRAARTVLALSSTPATAAPVRHRPAAEPAVPHRYPTLAMIDRARGATAPAFESDLHAAALESLARALATDVWPSDAWLTGMISPAMLDAVVTRLDVERQEMRDGIRVFVVTEGLATHGAHWS